MESPSDQIVGTSTSQMALAVKRAQAATLLERLSTTLMVNALVSFSALVLSGINRGITWQALLWFSATITTIALRGVMARMMTRRQLPLTQPMHALRTMTFGAFLSGLTWSALPFSLPGFEPLGVDGGIYILMCGMGTGAVLLGTGHAVTALAFALPVHLAVIASLLISTSTGGQLLAINVLALTLVLYKSSMKGENIVSSNVEAKLHATAMAQSLTQANTDILRANQRLEILANCDPLTGLANRSAFNTALADGIERARDGEEQLALLILDLDRFKTINDTFGHSAGDDLLLEASRRLRKAVGSEATVARLGGDEFAVIIGGMSAAADARWLADTIIAACREPFRLQGRPALSGVSIGIGIWPEHADNADDLFVCADMALYLAKDEGRGLWREFDHALKAQAERRHRIEQDLGAAITAGQVRPFFQPQVDLGKGRVTGFEALVRWRHAELGPISPPEIVTAAHATNLSEALTASIAKHACHLLTMLPSLGLPTATVAINVSPREFELYSVADALDRITGAFGIDPSLFEIEITEEAILDTLIAGEQLKHIERSGYKLAVDDFGAGHSSLAYLVGLKVDRLKLDRRFVTGISESRQNQEIVGALTGLGRTLSMDVVAEGVETEQEAATLRSLNCPSAQGYYFGHPMPAESIAAWLATRMLTPAA